MSASAFTPTVLTISSGTGSGSGEKNYITNPSMASATTGWNVVGDFALTRSTSASELPREYTTATGIKMVATAGTQSTADYIFFDFILDDVDLNKKMKIKWSQKRLGTYAAGQLAVIITTQSDRTTALHTPITTAIPAVDTEFETTFDSGSTAALSIVIRATADMTTNDGLCLSDVIVGPGINAQGAAISEWQSYVPTGSWVSNATYVGRWRRVGSQMEVQVRVELTGAPTAAALTINIPSGHTIDTATLLSSDQGAATGIILGTALALDAGTQQYPAIVVYNNTTSVAFRNPTGSTLGFAGTTVSNTHPFSFGNLDRFYANFTVPIAEWAGNGTVNLGPGAQVTYYHGTGGTWGTTGTLTTAIGPGGALGGTTTPSGTFFDWTIVPAFPISSTSTANLEVSPDGVRWSPTGGAVGSIVVENLRFDNTNFIGAAATINSSGNIVVRFGKYPYGTTATPYTGTWYWRVAVANPSSPVGFGLAAAGTSGLVSSESTGTASVWLKAIGGADITGPVTIRWTRVGKIVTVLIPAISASTANTQLTLSTTQTSGVNTWPTEITPARQHYCIYSAISSTTYSAAIIGINSSGVCQLSSDMAGSSFTGSTVTKGVGVTTTITYMLD